MRKFTELVVGFQACAARVKISVRLWLMDALSCCDFGLPVGQLFDSVDTSNLADNVELLNLLLMAGPRVKKTPHSRFAFKALKAFWLMEAHNLKGLLTIEPALSKCLTSGCLCTHLRFCSILKTMKNLQHRITEDQSLSSVHPRKRCMRTCGSHATISWVHRTSYSNRLHRLFAHTMIWRGSLRSYLDSSLGVPPEMMPAMYGLRLLTDLTLGTPAFQYHPPLEWAPALESTSALHMSSGVHHLPNPSSITHVYFIRPWSGSCTGVHSCPARVIRHAPHLLHLLYSGLTTHICPYIKTTEPAHRL